MNLNFKKISALIICFHLIYILNSSKAQTIQFSNSFDYNAINKNTFIPITHLSDTFQYSYSILKHCHEMQKINTCKNDTSFFWNTLKGNKTVYSTDSLRLFFIRPNDNLIRPCILLTNGSGASFDKNWSSATNFFALDLAMRGFCVAYYENPSSAEAAQKYYSIASNTRKLFYNGFQAAVAINSYINYSANNLKIDTSKLIAAGYSFGAYCSLALATADLGINFTDTLFNAQGNFTATSKYPFAYTKNIKRVISIGGGLPKSDTTTSISSLMGNFIEENDASLAILFLHGNNDNLVNIDKTIFNSVDSTVSYFLAEGPLSIKNNMAKNNLNTTSILFTNCRGSHPFINSVCGINWNCIEQYQWPYLSEPNDGITSNDTYFTDPLNDSLLRLFNYMTSQIAMTNSWMCDFLNPLTTQQHSTFNQSNYYIEPQDSFTFEKFYCNYLIKNKDCDGNEIITKTGQHKSTEAHVRIYPNPTNYWLKIDAESMIKNFKIYNVLGVLVKELTINSHHFELPIYDLEDGIYQVAIDLGKSVINKKLVITK
ncbi:MAG: T9SS type A sorting domain-containing protein [Chitinophagales bacterium]|nr:T9SS type A sorting domain-containing protein [Chitinophagales bacterium]MBP6155109.1 T9SS type A sorting domain-containing protein [Chitinophagales bacterium]